MNWTNQKQRFVALSSTESEYMALSRASTEVVWLRHLLITLNCLQSIPIVMYSDNQSAIQLTENPCFHDGSKQISIQIHFVQEEVVVGEVTMKWIPTYDMAAYLLTKSLSKDKYYHCLKLLGLKADMI